MTETQLADFAPLWGPNAKTKYALLSLAADGTDLSRCMIVDLQNKSVKLIENRELVLEVMQKMVEAGVQIVRNLPVEE